jgi:organic radical activating enzyme
LWYDGLEVDYLSGNFDLMIQSTCNLHCKDCSILDWKGNEYPGQTMKLEDVININEKLIKLGIILEKLTLLGGEPTLNKDIIKIIKYLSKFKNITFKELRLITNGLNFKKDIIKSFEGLDSLRISVYPYSKDIEVKLKDSHLLEYLESITNVEIKEEFYFSVYGTEDPKLDYVKSDVPFDYCEKCPQPALKKPWQSNNPEVDKKNTKRGISLIKEWNDE